MTTPTYNESQIDLIANDQKHQDYCKGLEDGEYYLKGLWDDPTDFNGLSEHYFRGFKDIAGFDPR